MITGYTCYPFLPTDSRTELPPIRQVEVACWDGTSLAKINFEGDDYVIRIRHIVSDPKEIESVYKYRSIVDDVSVPVGEVVKPWYVAFVYSLSCFVSAVAERLRILLKKVI